MRSNFPEFYKPSRSLLKKIWNTGIFVFDSSVLLDLYRYSSASKESFAIMEKIKSQLWMPHQVGYEFHKNRPKTIFEIDKVYDLIISELTKSKEMIGANSRGWTVFSVKDINLEIDQIIAGIRERKTKYSQNCSKDLLLKKVSRLFAKKIGKSFSDKELGDIFAEGDRRYAESIPPGYMDINKDQGDKSKINKYGDLLVWKQMIAKSKDNKKPIIFITSDSKEDWWRVFEKKEFVGPRPELIREFTQETKNHFYMYRTEDFLKYAPKYLKNVTKNPDAIAEIQQINKKDDEITRVADALSDYLMPEVGTTSGTSSASINSSANIEAGHSTRSHSRRK